MATAQQVQALKNEAAAFDTINLEKLTRKELGVEFLAADLEPRLAKINRLRTLANEYANGVHDSVVSQMGTIFDQLTGAMSQQAARANPEFIANRGGFLAAIDSNLETAKQWEPAFITAAVEARGFLADEGIRQEYQRTVAISNTRLRQR